MIYIAIDLQILQRNDYYTLKIALIPHVIPYLFMHQIHFMLKMSLYI